jgi:hypothetical protein
MVPAKLATPEHEESQRNAVHSEVGHLFEEGSQVGGEGLSAAEHEHDAEHACGDLRQSEGVPQPRQGRGDRRRHAGWRDGLADEGCHGEDRGADEDATPADVRAEEGA